MTAINIIRQASAVHVIADGANYDPSGRSLFPSAKLWPLPHLPAVIAGRGPMLLLPMVATFLGSVARDYDELKSVVVGSLRAYLPEFASMMRNHDEPDTFDLLVAGTSSRGPDSYFVCSHDHSGLAPWKVHDLSSVVMVPASDAIEREFAAAFDGMDVEDLDPARDGVRMLEIQRANWPNVSAAAQAYVPGGFAQVMSVLGDNITTRVVRRW